MIEEMLDVPGPGGFTFRDLGITADHLRKQMAHREEHEEEPAESVPVQPQVRRQTLRNRLATRSRTVHQRILTDLGLARAGFDISRAIKGLRGNNADALFMLLNQEINNFVGQGKKTREKWTLDQLQSAYDSLDEIGDQVAATISAATEE